MADLLPALIQLPFIAAFIWFALRLSNDYRTDAQQRDAHWMEFLSLEREQRKQAMDQGMAEVNAMTEGMREMTRAVSSLAKSIVEHNAGSVERHTALKEKIDSACKGK